MDKADYRIIDANFNRAREGLRLIEEFCRFSLDDPALSGTAKQLRHKLSSAIATIDNEKLLAARDTIGDVGCGLEIKEPIKRASRLDCLTAAFSRTVEALRVISEIISIFDTKIAGKVEQIRYACYTLQKNVSIYAAPAKRFAGVRLYCIVGAGYEKSPLELAKLCAENGADCIQLRLKNMSDRQLLTLASEFVDICKQNDVISIINDRVDIACVCGADGVHLGQGDLAVTEARKFQIAPLIIGYSTHNSDELNSAISQRPSYIATGAAFASATKSEVSVVGIGYVEQVNKILQKKQIAHVAIGGIDLANVSELNGIGVKTVAVSSCICADKDPGLRCRELKAVLASDD